MDQLRSLSPELSKSDDPLDQVSDESFERMEKICELLEKEEIKSSLPHFSNEQEEAEYILSIEKYIKDHQMEFSSESEIAILSKTLENINGKDDSSSSSISDQQEVKEIADTLAEVDFILAMDNLIISTPKCPNRNKIPATEVRSNVYPEYRPDMRNVTFRKRNLTPKTPLFRSSSASPSCRTQAAVSHSSVLSPFHY